MVHQAAHHVLKVSSEKHALNAPKDTFEKLVIKLLSFAIPHHATNVREVSGKRIWDSQIACHASLENISQKKTLRHVMIVLSVILEMERYRVQDVRWVLARFKAGLRVVKYVLEATMARAAKHAAQVCIEMELMVMHSVASRVSPDSFNICEVNCHALSVILVFFKQSFRKHPAYLVQQVDIEQRGACQQLVKHVQKASIKNMKDLPYAFDVYQVVIKRTKDRQSAIVADLDTSCRQQFMEVLASHAFQGAIRANGSKYRASSANRAVSVRRKGCRCRVRLARKAILRQKKTLLCAWHALSAIGLSFLAQLIVKYACQENLVYKIDPPPKL